jgi:hypothetical protein
MIQMFPVSMGLAEGMYFTVSFRLGWRSPIIGPAPQRKLLPKTAPTCASSQLGRHGKRLVWHNRIQRASAIAEGEEDWKTSDLEKTEKT